MSEEAKNDIIIWIICGWSFQIIHKMVRLKYGYNIKKEELNRLKDKVVTMNLQFIINM